MNAEDKRTEIINRMLKAESLSGDAARSNDKLEATPVNDGDTPEPIAIIGLSGYLPQSHDVREFWKALDADQSLIEEIPSNRIDLATMYDPTQKDPDKIHTKWAGIIPNIREFDAQFFGILPSEASLMDPRKRLLLMAVYHALEDAGYAPKSLKKNAVGVFVGIEEDEYRQCLIERGVDVKSGQGSSSSLIANQISYYFDFHGPSEVINTMCSGAAVAIHRAVGALRSGEISYAVVGAANILLHTDPFIFLSRTGQMSPVDSVRSFGKDARGFLRADGVGTIILKPLSKALADNDGIYALIKNSAVNYNGQGGMSMAAPNISAHANVISKCYNEAGIDAHAVTYIEAQGMGNPVADIAEWEAFNRSLKSMASKKNTILKKGSCRVSTIKPMTGHMHSASALGALFKIIRSFQTNKIHKILGFKDINPDLDTNDQPCRLVTETEHWSKETNSRLAGLHSYGSGGNNAHILVEEFKASQKKINAPVEKVIVPCSAETEEQCRLVVRRLADIVKEHSDYSIESIAFTMQVGRDHMTHRVAFITNSREDFIRQADAFLKGAPEKHTITGVLLPSGNHDAKHSDTIRSSAVSWVSGAHISWAEMMPSTNITRLHLPVYPFNCQNYWIEEKEIELSAKHISRDNCVQPNSENEYQNILPAINEIIRKPAIVEVRDLNSADYHQMIAKAEDIVRNTLAFFLKTSSENIVLEKEFSAMGFDSLLVTNLRQRFEKHYGLQLESAIFFEHTSPQQLITFLADRFSDQLSNLSQSEAKKSSDVPSEVVQVNVGKENISGNGKEQSEPIAIIGLAGTFPQSSDVTSFWKNIIAGKNCIEEIPLDRWDVNLHFHPEKEVASKTGRSYGKWGGFVKDLYYFDPLFFNISPTEAANMNPKERIFLQCTWHTLEDAGYTPQSLSHEQVGVFVGVTRSGLDPYKVSMFPVANRVSYTFNFKGPSMPIDTACSSSLVAVHEACQHIHAGECTVAIAGGVHGFLDPSHFSSLSSLQMLSPDGVTRSFGDQANGMVPGEGVGAILLKPLSKAVADGDHIYGVIRSSATNHGGKANGFTVPNPKAHTALIQHALKKANISARDINYVEAHGTGTSLGDPIEIRGLSEAFRHDTTDNQYCPIGSIKSNIGHLEAAAGISGLTKVLLQMKYGKIAPSLNSETPNIEINFAKTPFYIQQKEVNWYPVGKDGQEQLRTACLSSFGAGGSNAHLILQEHKNVIKSIPAEGDTKCVILLSAKNESRLKAQAIQLINFLQENGDTLGIRDVAYTLQIGREAMEQRLAIEVSSLTELAEKLKHYVDGTNNIAKLYSASIKKHKEQVALQSTEIEKLVDDCVAKQDYEKLLSLWVKGCSLDWKEINWVNGELPHRVSLPGYPFEKEYFGLPDAGNKLPSALAHNAVIHPLLHRNISSFSEQKFIAKFSGEEFFLKDHVVRGKKFLPGVAYLEMVRAGMTQAIDPEEKEKFNVQLKNVAWIKPVAVEEHPVELLLCLSPAKDGDVSFEIYSQQLGTDINDVTVHCQGTATMVSKLILPSVNIEAIRLSAEVESFPADQCYKIFDSIGITYGPSHQGINQLFINSDQVLAKLSLPQQVTGTLEEFCMHPSLMDAAFQSIMGLLCFRWHEGDGQLPLAVPFALEKLTVLNNCTTDMWAHIRCTNANNKVINAHEINNLSFDIDLCDEQGSISVQMKGFVSRALSKTKESSNAGLLFLKPNWEARPVSNHAKHVFYDQHVVLYHGVFDGNSFEEEQIRFSALQGNENDLADFVMSCTTQVFAEIKRLLSSKFKGNVILQLLISEGKNNEMLSSIAGLLRTAHMENPQFFGQVINVPEEFSKNVIVSTLKECAQSPEQEHIRYSHNQRLVWSLQEYTPPKIAVPMWKKDNVYLITGGAGGLGLLLANEIVSKSEGAKIILTGRTNLTEQKKYQLEKLSTQGAAVVYKQIDVSDEKAVHELVKSITKEFGKLNIVIHCAGVIHDNYILKKTDKEIRGVFAPKVNGLINLDRATKDIALDNFIAFSSVAGVMGNTAQSDYAVANAFMDRYVSFRNMLAASGLRKGAAVSINWPLWKEGGMSIGEVMEKIMQDTIGMYPLQTASGLLAFSQIIASGEEQVVVAEGKIKLLRKTFLNSTSLLTDTGTFPLRGSASGNEFKVKHHTDEVVKEKAIAYFKRLLSGVIGLSTDRIDADASMDEYGIDSVMVMQMTTALEKVFGSLSKTLFFEYHSVVALTEYFLDTHIEKLQELLGISDWKNREENVSAAEIKLHEDKHVVTKPSRKRNRFASIQKAAQENNALGALDIAIIGIAGRYPQARNMDAFWDILKEGKNCITEVPKDRWDHDLYFDQNKELPGKTYTKWGGFIDGVDEFDPLFFNISPKEAEVMDPQERLFLQCTYEALQDAGYTRDTLAKNAHKVGVYVGVMWEEYQLYAAQETTLGRPMVLSSSPSSIANRVSFYFNLHGPSIAVDTMCSSSLTSIHLACQSLRLGECEAAIAGGVNVSIHPNKFLVLGYGRYASSKGLCESFGIGGDGYVAGEGVGAVLLKPLSKAIADNDQIYGVIKGTAVNHGGKANGFTVPNPRAQANVIDDAMKMAGFEARTISYMEAHGTGTSLGDPIEFAGLCKAFDTTDKKFCSLGSVKSNIGHCESAAGISGVSKVLMQMKHRQLAPSLHSKSLNPNIDFDNSPFVVQQELAEWKRPVLEHNGQVRTFPRRAGISSFGAGGSNAHVLIEEFIAEQSSGMGSTYPVAIVFSARNESQLKTTAEQLLQGIDQGIFKEADLSNLAYTLQVGREGMAARAAIKADSLSDLHNALSKFTKGETDIDNLYTGEARSNKGILSLFTSDEDIESAVDSWLRKKKYSKLLGLWVNGFDIEWEKLYADLDRSGRKPKRISLPTYPFARNRYWPTLGNVKLQTPADSATSVIHPMVHANTSTFAEQKFTTLFSGREFFLTDHRVNGEKILPGVAYLEMVNQAMAIASGREHKNLCIENIAWIQPLMVNGHPEKAEIKMLLQNNGDAHFEIKSSPHADDTSSFVYSSGVVKYIERTADITLDVELIKSRATKIISKTACYQLYNRIGITYGPAHQAIENIYVADDNLLAELRIPEEVANTIDWYYLHPSLMDASLQAVIGFLTVMDTSSNELPLAIPYTIQSVQVMSRCTKNMWASVRYHGEHQPTTSVDDIGQLSFDIDICDNTGRICVQIQGYTSRIVKQSGKRTFEKEMMLVEPSWRASKFNSPKNVVQYGTHLIVVLENEGLAKTISGQVTSCKVIDLNYAKLPAAEAFENYALDVFREIKILLTSRPKQKMLMQIVVASQGRRSMFIALAGLLKTAQFENPLFKGQIIVAGEGDDIASILKENIQSVDDIIRHRHGHREVFNMQVYVPSVKTAPIWKDGGVYLITGGAGGLGLIFATEIADKTKQATVILSGRSPMSDKLETHLSVLRTKGLNIKYLPANIADRNSVYDLVQSIIKDHGQLDGIIHSAGVLRDNFIIKKSEEEIKEVFAPKVHGLANLDLETIDIKLDFFILCSSTTAVTGNAGQADYAMANAYLDSFASFRQALVHEKLRYGRTLSMNWPLWKEGGMQIPEENEKDLLKNFGMVPLASEVAFHALYHAIDSELSQMIVLQGDLQKLRSSFLQEATVVEMQNQVNTFETASPQTLIQPKKLDSLRTSQYLTGILSEVLKLPFEEIDVDMPMEEYGIDSVMVMKMTSVLEKVFGTLSKTLFFEYHTIKELTEYFEGAFADKLSVLLGDPVDQKKGLVEKNTSSHAVINNNVVPNQNGFKNVHTAAVTHSKSDIRPSDVAIIGLSGSYPQARDIVSFWNALKEGKNCVTEIPEKRWDHSLYFDREKNKPGKTYSRWGGFLDGVDEFDPLFFNISPKEAEIMDPQERLFLQCVYETLEDAGYTRATMGRSSTNTSGNVGVYVGVMNEEYQLYAAQENQLGRPVVLSGNSASIANRVSYYFNFHGPSIALNTMCSSSLTCIHLACQSLQLGECDVAIAGGVNVTIHPNKYLTLGYGTFLSTKGLCESFGAGGDGYVPGEGVGAVLLKPLAKAIEDKDHIYGVIKGTAVNHGGKTNGYTVPNPNAQENVIAKALSKANFQADTISYLEAHGTGTLLGDPIEITGLNKAFSTERKQFCAIGSVKSNIGHCESAAGIAGLTKVLLQMKYETLVPSLHAETLNPNIDFLNSPFVVQRELAEWKRPVSIVDGKEEQLPRRAGISSFGAGGANAHILIEEYSPKVDLSNRDSFNRQHINSKPVLVVLSAKNSEQLREQTQKLLHWIQQPVLLSHKTLIDMAYTLQTGREAMDERLAMEANSVSELAEKLNSFLINEQRADGIYRGNVHETKAASKSLHNAMDMQKLSVDVTAHSTNAQILNSWVKGVPFDWNLLYDKTDIGKYLPQRISLPTYSFIRRRCWFDDKKPSGNTNALQKSLEQNSHEYPKPILLKKEWGLSNAVPSSDERKNILILCTDETLSLAKLLQEKFKESTLINATKAVDKSSERLSTIEWENVDGFIDLIGCGNTSDGSMNWITWIQKTIDLGKREGIVMIGVTQGLTFFENKSINLAGAKHAGLYRMLSSEYSHVVSRHVDLESASSLNTAADQIVNELLISDLESEVCYRAGSRYAKKLTDVYTDGLPSKRRQFSNEQVLLITGGTRGLGYLCAKHFVQHYGVKRLILTGQEELPARSEWNKYQSLHSEMASKIRNILAIEALGVEIKVLSVPLDNNVRLVHALAEIKKVWGEIHGVIHCAGKGDHDNPAFIRKSIDHLRNVMSPKVEGVNNLHACLKNEPLAFFILFSSVSAIIPALGSGQSAYAMANAYMDHFAEARSADCPIISIQWPNWKDTGMGEVKTKGYKETGLGSLTDAEGLQLLDMIIHNCSDPVILPAFKDKESFDIQKLCKFNARHKSISDNRKIEKSNILRRNDASPVLPETVKAWLTELFSAELKLDAGDLQPDRYFHDYGIDSIMITQLLQPVKKALQRDIDPSIIYEYSTLATFSEWLANNFPDELTAFFQTPASTMQNAEIKKEDVETISTFKEVSAKSQEPNGHAGADDIAVIGMACRFPGARDLNEYWKLLSEGRSAIETVSQARWNSEERYTAGWLHDVEYFDPKFFLLHEEDACAMDPQALLVLEETLKLFYHAGYTLDEVKGKAIGVYLGGRSTYSPSNDKLSKTRNPILAVGQNYLSANISQFFDLRGPGMVIDTACSSALVGMKLAIQALQNREIESAVVGGVNLLGSEETHQLFKQRGILSQGEAFHLFDQRAKGIVLGEGVGMVLLKTVNQAVADGDHVYAVIKSIATNNDGRTAGPATPNIEAQKDVMRNALAKCGKNPEDISYIEVNGSGSEITDLLELKAINAVYRSSGMIPCNLGSVKPNIGHPLCAEGIAGFIKVALMLHHKQLVPFLSGQHSMKYFNMESSPFHFIRALSEWPLANHMAAINCFADGGTNAHVILERFKTKTTPRRLSLSPPVLNRKKLVTNSVSKASAKNEDNKIPIASEVYESVWETFN